MPIFLLRNFVTNLLGLQIILDYSVSNICLSEFSHAYIAFMSHSEDIGFGSVVCWEFQMRIKKMILSYELDKDR